MNPFMPPFVHRLSLIHHHRFEPLTYVSFKKIDPLGCASDVLVCSGFANTHSWMHAGRPLMVMDRQKKFPLRKGGKEIKAEEDQGRHEQRDTDTLRDLRSFVCVCERESADTCKFTDTRSNLWPSEMSDVSFRNNRNSYFESICTFSPSV